MARSQNGWSALEERPPYVTVPGTDVKIALRPGDVAYLLTRVASWFHHNIERLDMPVTETPGYDEWGWAYRPVRGQDDGLSNHASGTAEDLNATQHPRGVKGTFTEDEKRRIRAHLREYKGVVRWGEDYTGTVDGMHFEINADRDDVALVAAQLRELDSRREDEDEMQLSDTVTGLGAGNQNLLNQPDGTVTVGQLLVQSAAQSTLTARKLDELVKAQARTNELLAALLRQTAPAPTPPATPAGG